MRFSSSSRRQTLHPLGAPKCTKGVPCGSVCISKGEKCHAKELAFDERDPQEYARGFHEYTAALFSGFENPRTGRADIAGFRSLPESKQKAALKEAHRFIENGLIDGTGIDKHHERMVDALSAAYDQDYPQGLGVIHAKTKTKRRAERGNRKDSLVRGDRKSPGKCGKGWEPGPGGKCVRKRRRQGMALNEKIGMGLAATGVGLVGLSAFGAYRENKQREARVKAAQNAGVSASKIQPPKIKLSDNLKDRAKKLTDEFPEMLERERQSIKERSRQSQGVSPQSPSNETPVLPTRKESPADRAYARHQEALEKKRSRHLARKKQFQRTQGRGLKNKARSQMRSKGLLRIESPDATRYTVKARRNAQRWAEEDRLRAQDGERKDSLRFRGDRTQSSVRRDAPPRAKCDKDHGWTRGAGSCIRKKRNRAAIKGAAKTALVAAKSVTGAIVGAAAAGTLMGGTIAGRKLRDSVRSRVRGQVSKDRKDLLHEKSK